MHHEKGSMLEVERTTAAGRQIAEWKFNSPFRAKVTPGVVGPSYAVKVLMHSSSNGILFRAQGDCLGGRMLEHSDIEQLRQNVEEALWARHDVEMNLVWEDWLEVEVGGTTRSVNNRQHNGQLVIAYRRVKRGVDQATGNAYALNSNHIAVPFPRPQQYRSAQSEAEEMFGDGEKEVSYIRATPENVAALDGLLRRLDELRGALSGLLSQEKVELSLENIRNNFAALPFIG